eukprot:TRINITY_DN33371_c0_g1_i2.p1 TRINITY_DN33371_c0_g1~~TRINITY_DN33371_c0_g1_i2.p1  ORF type:complete len:1061 (+),score=137.46 TRINITY_DN33371_c0_g1_i2:334-3516(+)
MAEVVVVGSNLLTVSDDYNWDGPVGVVMLVIWLLIRQGLLLRTETDGNSDMLVSWACDFYCVAYGMSVLTTGATLHLIPAAFVTRLRALACQLSCLADIALVSGLAVGRPSRCTLQDDGVSLARCCLILEVCWHIELILAAVLPGLLQQSVPPGFFGCAGEGDGLGPPRFPTIWPHLLPAVFAFPTMVMLQQYRMHDAPYWFFGFMFIIAPAFAWAVSGIFVGYIQRKLQLLVGVGMLRTGGALGVILCRGPQLHKPTTSTQSKKQDSDDEEPQAASGSGRIQLTPVALMVVAAITIGLFAGAWKTFKATLVVPSEPRDFFNERPKPVFVEGPLEGDPREFGVETSTTTTTTTSAAPLKPGQKPPPDPVASCLKVDRNTTQFVRCVDPTEMSEEGKTHVMYACDLTQLQGLQASVHSLVTAARHPKLLSVYIVVGGDPYPFAFTFGLPKDCLAVVTVQGALIRFVGVENTTKFQNIIPKLSEQMLKDRGNIAAVENYARFYIPEFVKTSDIVVYLDADTIVLDDIAELQQELRATNRTIGFVRRPLAEQKVLMKDFLRKAVRCKRGKPVKWSKAMLEHEAYNVGIVAINLARWQDKHMSKRVEELVALHNDCAGGIWLGGSQPPMLLAFFNEEVNDNTGPDYHVFGDKWNGDGLGWKTQMSMEGLLVKSILHWSGPKKPWKSHGLFKDLWQPSCDNFAGLFQVTVATSTTLPFIPGISDSPCPDLELLDDWTQAGRSRCEPRSTFGCDLEGKLWTSGGCEGMFFINGQPTWCGRPAGEPYPDNVCTSRCAASLPFPKKQWAANQTCQPGNLPPAHSRCNLVVMTTFFTTKRDWQRLSFVKPSYKKMQKLYETSMKMGVNVTMLYDKLPDEIVNKYSNPRFQFVKIDFRNYDRRLGVNDVRYFIFHDELKAKKNWKYVFLADAFDVRVTMNPCSQVRENQLYVGIEKDKLKGHPWMKQRFEKMGGKYEKWYNSINDELKILNAGLVGGNRKVMMEFFKLMKEAVLDPETTAFKQGMSLNLNMAALNYIVYHKFTNFSAGMPLHSRYKHYEDERQDVWFVHK